MVATKTTGLLLKSTYICPSCARQIPPPSVVSQKRGITQAYLQKTLEAKEDWAKRATEIKAGKQDSMLTMLEKRGYVNQIVGDRDDLDRLMTEKRVGIYVGVDPTAASMHVGHLLPLMVLHWAYMKGFHACSLLGGATAQIGDPEGRISAREAQHSSVRKVNMAKMHLQLKSIWMNVEKRARDHGYHWEWAWRREVTNNNMWLNKTPVVEMLKLLGRGVRLGTMLGRESVKQRMQQGDGMSVAEFMYPLLQSWDWWHMYSTKDIQVQVGGSDQFGNILSGIDAINHIRFNHFDPDVRQDAEKMKTKEALLNKPMGFTVPLLKTKSGEKFGKSAGNAIWLDQELTSAFELYQFFLRMADADVHRYLKLFTFEPLDVLESLMQEHNKKPSERMAQHKLARDVLELVHGSKVAEEAERQHRTLFQKGSSSSLPDISVHVNSIATDSTPDVHEKRPFYSLVLPKSLVYNQPISRVLYHASLARSRSQAFRMVNSKGVYLGARPSASGTMGNQLDFSAACNWQGSETEKYIIGGNTLIVRVGKWNVKIIEIINDEEFEARGLTAPGWKEDIEDKPLTQDLVKMKTWHKKNYIKHAKLHQEGPDPGSGNEDWDKPPKPTGMSNPSESMEDSSNSSPAAPPSLKKSTSSSKNQTSIAGFFRKKDPVDDTNGTPNIKGAIVPVNSYRGAKIIKKPLEASSQSLTPAPSSDAAEEPEEESVTRPVKMKEKYSSNGLLSPITPASVMDTGEPGQENIVPKGFYSPSRKAKKAINYAVDASSGEEDYGDNRESSNAITAKKSEGRALKRRKTSVESDDDDVFVGGAAIEEGFIDGDDFIVEDDSDEAIAPKRKRKIPSPAKASSQMSAPAAAPGHEELGQYEELPATSTATQWTFDPSATPLTQKQARKANRIVQPSPTAKTWKGKEKAHKSEPEQRYSWLKDIRDMDGNKPGHPDYDSRTIYVPPGAMARFTAFEKQYWEIKQKYWDTIVFFKKGKFYELYENDATIGHQLFDLKLTDRVNMRMVGVPEASLHTWANQFVAKGYKIARVDQVESALGKEMRERDNKQPGKAAKDKVISRQLASVLTSGTLVDSGMLQDDMSTYCVAIKESELDSRPAFGIAFVDAASGQFFLTDVRDDPELTKFETFVAQMRPRELLVERSCISSKALRILKNSTAPSTLWNYLKAGKEFWTADTTNRELGAGKYFVNAEGDDLEAWPKTLVEARDNELVMSAFGALVQYLQTLQIERELLTLKNISWYDPIKSASTLILDGKSLLNLEIFANSFDGGIDGTLFTILNRCITPFGKRMFKQWVCHPLTDADHINARLDAVESLNADATVRDQFISNLTKLPDLERMISRIHAGSCKAQDFVRVLDGFEQIDYTMSLVRDVGSGEGIVGQLISRMPDMKALLAHWKSAFDHEKAKEAGLLIPERGVEEDFDDSQDRVEEILANLETLLKKTRKDLGCSAIEYRDNGKEIYQLEVPINVKGVPKNWNQMSGTAKVKRYYSPELRVLVRKYQEAQETHGQIVKEVSGRFFQAFDKDYETWLAAVQIISHLDCLISLARASLALGEPCCRPEFVDDERSVLEFEDLRHPCMLGNVTDFIPNDVKLGGNTANISLLTGANAAGKSTILRMTCIAVIMAQIGCFVPATSARMTPVDRIMSRLGANDNIFAAQSTFFVELAETKKILSEATPRSLVILDELGRGTSSYDGVAVAQAVLHHVATHIGCVGFFATHYHSLAEEFSSHPEIRNRRMRIHVDDENRRVTFLYKLEDGVAEGSFGMHCASMCGIPSKVVERAEVAAREWEHTSRLKESLEVARQGCWVPLGMQSDVAWMLREVQESVGSRGVDVLRKAIAAL